MIPPIVVPLLVQFGSLLLDYAFKKLDQMPAEKKNKCLDKIEANDKKKLDNTLKEGQAHDDW